MTTQEQATLTCQTSSQAWLWWLWLPPHWFLQLLISGLSWTSALTEININNDFIYAWVLINALGMFRLKSPFKQVRFPHKNWTASHQLLPTPGKWDHRECKYSCTDWHQLVCHVHGSQLSQQKTENMTLLMDVWELINTLSVQGHGSFSWVAGSLQLSEIRAHKTVLQITVCSELKSPHWETTAAN